MKAILLRKNLQCIEEEINGTLQNAEHNEAIINHEEVKKNYLRAQYLCQELLRDLDTCDDADDLEIPQDNLDLIRQIEVLQKFIEDNYNLLATTNWTRNWAIIQEMRRSMRISNIAAETIEGVASSELLFSMYLGDVDLHPEWSRRKAQKNA